MSNGSHPRLEACVTSVVSARAAAAGGAARLELCVAPRLDGLTPPDDLVAGVRDAVDIQLVVLVRPANRFEATGTDAAGMLAAVRSARRLGADGVAIGARRDGRLDTPLLRELMAEAGDLVVTVHRVIDHVADRPAAMSACRELGVGRVLTSGGPGAAGDGLAGIAESVRLGDGIEVVAAGGVTAASAPDLVRATGVRWVHAHGALVGPEGATDAALVREFVSRLAAG